MLIDARTLESDKQFEADVCVVGAGPAGLAIAKALFSSNLKVVIVESGGLEADADTQSLYEGESVGRAYSIAATRVRIFGGSTAHWYGQCGRLRPFDLEKRHGFSFSGWPISYDELDPYYEPAHELLELGRYDYSEDNFKNTELGPLELKSEALSLHIWRFRSQNGLVRESVHLGTKFQKPIQRAENITVLLYANGISIDTDETASQVRHIGYRTLDGKSGIVRARFYVLACGGIENARLLLNTTAVNPSGLGNDRDLVGRFFQEHPNAVVGWVVPNEDGLYHIINYLCRPCFRTRSPTQRFGCQLSACRRRFKKKSGSSEATTGSGPGAKGESGGRPLLILRAYCATSSPIMTRSSTTPTAACMTVRRPSRLPRLSHWSYSSNSSRSQFPTTGSISSTSGIALVKDALPSTGGYRKPMCGQHAPSRKR